MPITENRTHENKQLYPHVTPTFQQHPFVKLQRLFGGWGRWWHHSSEQRPLVAAFVSTRAMAGSTWLNKALKCHRANRNVPWVHGRLSRAVSHCVNISDYTPTIGAQQTTLLPLPDPPHPEAQAAPRCIWCELFSRHSCGSPRSPVFFFPLPCTQRFVQHPKLKNT